MADSTVTDVSKMKVVDLRKELKTRGLSYAGDKAELVARLQAAMTSESDHGDINLDSDEIDSDGVLEDEDDKSQTDILDDSAVDTLNEELALADQPPAPKATTDSSVSKPFRTLKRKITTESKSKVDSEDNKEAGSKKIVLNRAISMISSTKSESETIDNKTQEVTAPSENNKVKITADVDSKTKLELRAKRFGLPVKMTEAERKEARKQRFGQATTAINSVNTSSTPGTLTENIDKLKKRAERFGQNVSKIMTDIENKERIERRKAKFGTVK